MTEATTARQISLGATAVDWAKAAPVAEKTPKNKNGSRIIIRPFRHYKKMTVLQGVDVRSTFYF